MSRIEQTPKYTVSSGSSRSSSSSQKLLTARADRLGARREISDWRRRKNCKPVSVKGKVVWRLTCENGNENARYGVNATVIQWYGDSLKVRTVAVMITATDK